MSTTNNTWRFSPRPDRSFLTLSATQVSIDRINLDEYDGMAISQWQNQVSSNAARFRSNKASWQKPTSWKAVPPPCDSRQAMCAKAACYTDVMTSSRLLREHDDFPSTATAICQPSSQGTPGGVRISAQHSFANPR